MCESSLKTLGGNFSPPSSLSCTGIKMLLKMLLNLRRKVLSLVQITYNLLQ